MVNWYLILGIVGLLMITSIISGIAESIEKKNRERKVRVLRFKRSIDEITFELKVLKDFELPIEIDQYLNNEIIARYEKISDIEPEYDASHELIEQAKITQKNFEEQGKNETDNPEQSEVNQSEHKKINIEKITELELQNKMSLLRNLAQYIQYLPKLSKENHINAIDFDDVLLSYRFENISKFYTFHAQETIKENRYTAAIEYMEKILAPIRRFQQLNTKLQEIKEQSETMIDDIRELQFQFLEDMRKETEAAEKLEKKKKKT